MLETRAWNPPSRPIVNGKLTMIAIWLLAFACMKGCAAEIAYGQVHQLYSDVQYCTGNACFRDSSVGSCVCVGKDHGRWIFVTAGHCLAKYGPGIVKSQPVKVEVGIKGKWVTAKVESYILDNLQDLGIVSIEYPGQLNAMPIAERLPAVGSEVKICGYPEGGEYTVARGELTNMTTDPAGPYDIVLKPYVLQGVSGGPVIANNEVIGIAVLSDLKHRTTTVATNCFGIRAMFHAWLGHLPDCGRPRLKPRPDPRFTPPQGVSPQMATPRAQTPPQNEGTIEGSTQIPNVAADAAGPGQETQPPAQASEAPGSAAGGVIGAVAEKAAGFAWGHWAVPWIVGVLGGGPIGMAGVWLAGKLARRVFSKGKDAVTNHIAERNESAPSTFVVASQSSPTQVPVVVQGPPPPQVVVTHPTFVPYETPNRDREAWEFAMREVVKKFPGTVETIETMKSLRDQYLILNPPKGPVTNAVSK